MCVINGRAEGSKFTSPEPERERVKHNFHGKSICGDQERNSITYLLT